MRPTKILELSHATALIGLLAGVLTFPCTPCRAGFVIDIVPVNSTVTAGSTNNFFEIRLRNTGGNTPASNNVAAFSFDLTTSNPGINFTLAPTSTAAAYIFPNSGFGPTISSTTGQQLTGSDIDGSSGSPGVTVGTTPVGLAEVFFDVASNATPGTYNITFDPVGTTLTDGNSGLNYTSVTINGGTITIQSVPEPGTIGIGLFTAAAGGFTWWRSKRRPVRTA